MAQPSTWDRDSLVSTLDEERDLAVLASLAADGVEGEEAQAIVRADQEGRESEPVQQVLQGVWKLGNQWIVEGDCPVSGRPADQADRRRCAETPSPVG